VVDGYPHILRSSIGFFLPAAVIGKLAGIATVDLALYVYAALGFSLFLLLLPLPTRPGRLLFGLLLVTIFFSGMDYLGSCSRRVPCRFSRCDSSGGVLLLSIVHRPGVLGAQSRNSTAADNGPVLSALGPARLAGAVSHPAAADDDLVTLRGGGHPAFLALATLRWFAQGQRFADSRITVWQIISATLMTWLTVRLMTLDIATIPGAPTLEVGPIQRAWFPITCCSSCWSSPSWRCCWRAICGIHGGCSGLLRNPGSAADLQVRAQQRHHAAAINAQLVFILLITLDQLRHWATRREFPLTAWAIGIVLLIGACTHSTKCGAPFSSSASPRLWAQSGGVPLGHRAASLRWTAGSARPDRRAANTDFGATAEDRKLAACPPRRDRPSGTSASRRSVYRKPTAIELSRRVF